MAKARVLRTILFFLMLFSTVAYAQETPEPDPFNYDSNQVTHPEWYLNVSKWSYFAPARVAMLSSVVIENTADIAYKDIKIRLIYSSYTNPVAGTIATDTTVLPVTVPPKSNDTYLKGGIPIGAGKQDYKVTDIEVLSATPIKD